MEMELELEVDYSVAIKRKKPWPKLGWLGEASPVFLFPPKNV